MDAAPATVTCEASVTAPNRSDVRRGEAVITATRLRRAGRTIKYFALRSVLGNHRTGEAIVDADGRHVDVSLDAVGARHRPRGRGQGDRVGPHKQVIVFDANRPVRREADLDAGTDSATLTGLSAGARCLSP
jgi:hypothetical protein